MSFFSSCSLFLQDILNHIFNDVEIFMGQIAAATAKNAKKKKKNKGNANNTGTPLEVIYSVNIWVVGTNSSCLYYHHVSGLPPAADFAECLQKIKCGFNLTVCALITFLHCTECLFLVSLFIVLYSFWQVELNGRINNPSAPEFVHFLFTALAFVSDWTPWILILVHICVW